jgi:hypothetical protein
MPSILELATTGLTSIYPTATAIRAVAPFVHGMANDLLQARRELI